MKKLFIYASVIASVLLAVSCQKKGLESVEGDASVRFTLDIPARVQTRAIAQAELTDIVYYEVWSADWKTKLYPRQGAGLASEEVVGKQAEITLTLVRDQTYNFIFWAQNETCGAYDVTDLKHVEVDYSVIAENGNQDKFDAFYAVKTFTVGASLDEEVTLYRPFSQLNFGASVMATSFGPVEVGATEITVTELATVFNTIDGVGETSTAAPVTFKANGLATTDKLKTNGQEYTWITMDYMLMLEAADVVEVTASFDLGMAKPVTHIVPNVSIKKNHRTNIVGDLFTADANLLVIVEPEFKDADGIPNEDEIVGL